MKKFLSLLLAAGFIFALAACGSDSGGGSGTGAAAEEIVIGGIAPLTGDVSQYGIAVNNGIKIAVEEINAAGGINGSPIKYVNYDDQGDPTEASNAYTRLVENDGAVAIIGAVTTKPTMAVAQLAAEDGIPVITPSGTGAAITQGRDNVFRACFTDPYQGELMAHYAKEKLNAQKVAILFDTGDDYSMGVADAFRATAEELGMEVVASEGFPSKATDFNSELVRIKSAEPDVVMVPCYYTEAALIMTQARGMGLTVPFLGPDGWDGLLNQLSSGDVSVLNNGMYCSQFSFQQPSDRLQAFMDAYVATYGNDKELNMFAVLGYEATYLMAEAIKAAGTTESAAIVAAMQNLTWEGVTGAISFKGGNDPVRDAYIIEFKDGEETLQGVFGF